MRNSEKEIREKQIDSTSKSIERLKSEIAAAYLGTYDVIEIRNLQESQTAKIKDILQNFAGLEILEQTASKIVARDLINVNEVSIKTLIRRIDIILRSMIEDAVECFEDCKKIKKAQFDERDKDVNRLVYLVSRIAHAGLKDPKLAKRFETNPVEIVCELEIAMRLESIGDNIKRLSRHIEHSKKDEKQFDEIAEIFKRIRDKYLILMKAYYSGDINTAFELEINSKELFEKCDALFFNGPNRHTFTLITKLKNLVISIRYAARSMTNYKF